MPSVTVQRKARRLLNEGKVKPEGQAQTFTVIGDDGVYKVAIGPALQFCTCEANARHDLGCSHIEAGLEWVLAQGDRAAGRSSRATDYEGALAARSLT